MGGCTGMVVPLGEGTVGGPWLEEVLGCCTKPEPDAEDWWPGSEGPKEVMDGWGPCWPEAWSWPEELDFDQGTLDQDWAWDLPGSLEPVAEPVAWD